MSVRVVSVLSTWLFALTFTSCTQEKRPGTVDRDIHQKETPGKTPPGSRGAQNLEAGLTPPENGNIPHSNQTQPPSPTAENQVSKTVSSHAPVHTRASQSSIHEFDENGHIISVDGQIAEMSSSQGNSLEVTKNALRSVCLQPAVQKLFQRSRGGMTEGEEYEEILRKRRMSLRKKLKVRILDESFSQQEALYPFLLFDGGKESDKPVRLKKCQYVDKNDVSYDRFEKTYQKINNTYEKLNDLSHVVLKGSSGDYSDGLLFVSLFNTYKSVLIKEIFMSREVKVDAGKVLFLDSPRVWDSKIFNRGKASLNVDLPAVFPLKFQDITLTFPTVALDTLYAGMPILKRPFVDRLADSPMKNLEERYSLLHAGTGFPQFQLDDALFRKVFITREHTKFRGKFHFRNKAQAQLVADMRKLYDKVYDGLIKNKDMTPDKLKTFIFDNGYAFDKERVNAARVGRNQRREPVGQVSHRQRVALLAWQIVLREHLYPFMLGRVTQVIEKLKRNDSLRKNVLKMFANTARQHLNELREQVVDNCSLNEEYVEYHPKLFGLHVDGKAFEEKQGKYNQELIEDYDAFCNAQWGVTWRTKLEAGLSSAAAVTFTSAVAFPPTSAVLLPASGALSASSFALSSARSHFKGVLQSTYFNPNITERNVNTLSKTGQLVMIPFSFWGTAHFGHQLTHKVVGKKVVRNNSIRSKVTEAVFRKKTRRWNKVDVLALKSVQEGLMQFVPFVGWNAKQSFLFIAGQAVSHQASWNAHRGAGLDPLAAGTFYIDVFDSYIGGLNFINLVGGAPKGKELKVLEEFQKFIPKLAKSQVLGLSLQHSIRMGRYFATGQETSARYSFVRLGWSASTGLPFKFFSNIVMLRIEMLGNGPGPMSAVAAVLANTVTNAMFQNLKAYTIRKLVLEHDGFSHALGHFTLSELIERAGGPDLEESPCEKDGSCVDESLLQETAIRLSHTEEGAIRSLMQRLLAEREFGFDFLIEAQAKLEVRLEELEGGVMGSGQKSRLAQNLQESPQSSRDTNGVQGVYVIDGTGKKCGDITSEDEENNPGISGNDTVMCRLARLTTDPAWKPWEEGAKRAYEHNVTRYYPGMVGSTSQELATPLLDKVVKDIVRDYNRGVQFFYIAGAGTGAIVANEAVKLVRHYGISAFEGRCRNGDCGRLKWLGLLDATYENFWDMMSWSFRSGFRKEERSWSDGLSQAADRLNPSKGYARAVPKRFDGLEVIHVHKSPMEYEGPDMHTGETERPWHGGKHGSQKTVRLSAKIPQKYPEEGGKFTQKHIPQVSHDVLTRFYRCDSYGADYEKKLCLLGNRKAGRALKSLLESAQKSGVQIFDPVKVPRRLREYVNNK